MAKKLKYLAFLTLCLAFLFGYAQEQKLSKVKHITYKENVNAPLTSSELQMINEVYQEFSQSDILDRPQRLKEIKNILRNRVEIYQENKKNLATLTKLSQVSLFNTYNETIERDLVFNPNTFNPLKYQFNFDSRRLTKRYRVDNTNYVIVVYAQHQQ